MDIAILSHSCCVPSRLPVGVFALVVELILTAGSQETRTYTRADGLRQFLLPKRGEAEHIARPILSFKPQMGLFAALEIWCFGTDIDTTCITEIAGRLEDGTLLPVIQRDILYIIQRKLPQVYLAVLRVA